MSNAWYSPLSVSRTLAGIIFLQHQLLEGHNRRQVESDESMTENIDLHDTIPDEAADKELKNAVRFTPRHFTV